MPTLGYSTANATVDYLGPTIVTKKGQPVDVTLVNGLPAAGTPMFPFDQPNNNNAVVMHRHGGLQAAADDGSPGQLIPPGGSRTNHYPNNQAAAPLWYHDHADMTTSYSVYEGLAGFMPNTDNLEPLFNLPSGNFAKAYVLQDKSFNADHTLCYTHREPGVLRGPAGGQRHDRALPAGRAAAVHVHLHQRLGFAVLPPQPPADRRCHRGQRAPR